MTTKKGGAVRPSLDIVNARSRCPREAAPSAKPARSCKSQLVAAHAARRQVAAGHPGR